MITDTDNRLLTIRETAKYIRVGVTNTRKFMDEIGATVKIGNRVLADKQVIDEYIDRTKGAKAAR